MSRRGDAQDRRKIDGILLLDKPAGISSNQALQRARRIFNARKAGHTGSLDPLATGLLPICFGEATKLSAFLLESNKTYWVECKLGEGTSTGDSEGEIISTASVPTLNHKQIDSVLNTFLGETDQVPPMYSAIKKQGKRLYQLAREGQYIEREARCIQIYSLQLENYNSPILSFKLTCSKGTYVRVLAEDIARSLGTVTHVTALRRLVAGPFGPTGMLTLEELEQARAEGESSLDSLLLPVDAALLDVPKVELNEDTAYYLRHGQAVQVPKAPTSGAVRIYELSGRFLGMGEIAEDGKVMPKRLIAGQ
ncbi:MAG: tRNA pseudouridine(55) synthase TruB [Gammaproteobacteria bacterium]